MHRRKTSKENQDVLAEDTVTTAGQPTVKVNGTHSTTPQVAVPFPDTPEINGSGSHSPRSRVNSVPSAFEVKVEEQLSYLSRQHPPSAGPYRTSFGATGSSPPTNGFAYPGSPFRQTFKHTRTLSSSGLPPMNGFPASHSMSSVSSRRISMHEPSSPRPGFQTSLSTPAIPQGTSSPGTLPSPATQNMRRHSRIHSRNLSVFFPRPGSLPHASIAEDGSQELEYGGHKEAPISFIPSASPGPYNRSHLPPPKQFGEGFTFGGRANSTSSTSSSDGTGLTPGASSKPSVRRGHHHKHSMSHSFYSFLDPGQINPQSSPEPGSPWNPASPALSSNSIAPSISSSSMLDYPSPLPEPVAPSIPKAKLVVGIVQFILGGTLWVSGQQIGSLGCTGLGYWVVFDAFGVILEHVLPGYLALESLKSPIRRPYGNARVETVALFAQSIYLIFAAVYVCKETVEHILLSLGNGHHHHARDVHSDYYGIEFPNFFIAITVASLISTNIFYGNHSKLIRTSRHKLPSIASIFKQSRSHNAFSYSPPTSSVSSIVSNPFSIVPIIFSLSLLIGSTMLPESQHAPFDLALAAVETVLTFSVAYPCAVVLGTVLLQTSPQRGMPGGRMESFLRAMREIERHPKVLHLPAPHIWQLTPTNVSPASTFSGPATRDALVVTLELHVRKDLDDDDVLELTKWAHDRCKHALLLGARVKEREEEPEVTVGIVRG